MDTNFILSKAGWHTQQVRNYVIEDELIYRCYKTSIRFFQENGLTTRIIVSDFSKIDDETSIRVSDLTEEGFLLFKKAYGRWLDHAVDKNKPEDTSILDRALKKIRNK